MAGLPMLNKIPNPFKTRFFSPLGFFFRALLILMVFLALHLAGCREYTSFITGTSSGNYLDILGMAYFIFYSLSVFLSPILIIASLFMVLFNHLAGFKD